jgi:hypothetical protein
MAMTAAPMRAWKPASTISGATSQARLSPRRDRGCVAWDLRRLRMVCTSS